MKRIAFMICLLIPIFGFSQTGYPKKITINGDTLIAITPEQLKDINVKLIERKECYEIMRIKDSTITTQIDIIHALEANINDYEHIISIKDSIVTEKDIQNQLLEQSLEAERKNVKRLKFTQKLFTFVGTVAGTGIGIIIGRAIK